MTTGNEIAIFSVPDLQDMALALSESKLFGVMTPQQAFALMLIAQADGLHPATVAREYEIIKDRPAMKSQAALARFQRAGGKIQWLKRSDIECSAEFSHPQGGTLVVTWDIARATAAKLAHKDNWKNIPQQMLSARVAAEGVRAVFPACLNGLYLVDEVRDFDDEPLAKLDKTKEVAPTGSELPKTEPPKATSAQPVLLSKGKAVALAARATKAGFTDAQIFAAMGDDPNRVTRAQAEAFFALVEAEEIAIASRAENAENAQSEAGAQAEELSEGLGIVPPKKELF